ncbi:hypothetical protein [Sorangium sp. So ce854]|uniref:hypothetical protein n=1 Tax=Sorangium sp. So ce854 TaxID=3133322 RepID=UPI003F5FE24E
MAVTERPREPFDLERVRRNWERAAEPPRGELPARLAQVEAPRDALGEARDLLDRVRGLAAQQLPAHAATLAPFFDEAAALLAGLDPRAAGAPPADARGEPPAGAPPADARGEPPADARGAPPADAKGAPPAGAMGADEARARLGELLEELEEILEVFATIKR